MAGEKLTRDNLKTGQAVFSLGITVINELEKSGVVAFFINGAGEVELCPQGEIELDGLEEDDALGVLLDRGYEDAQLMTYLKGRKARER